jgi:hypothetical protein
VLLNTLVVVAIIILHHIYFLLFKTKSVSLRDVHLRLGFALCCIVDCNFRRPSFGKIDYLVLILDM